MQNIVNEESKTSLTFIFFVHQAFLFFPSPSPSSFCVCVSLVVVVRALQAPVRWAGGCMVVWLRVNIFRLCVCVCRGCGASTASTASAGALGRRLHGCVAPLSLSVSLAPVCACVSIMCACVCVCFHPCLANSVVAGQRVRTPYWYM